MNGLLVAADERAAEVDTFEVVFFGLQVGDLADVVTVRDVRVSQNSTSGIAVAWFFFFFSRIREAYLIAYNRLREMSAGANMRPSPMSLLPLPSFLAPATGSEISPFSP